uniref:Mitochondrial import inner membrane translocase subunit Tim21 n=1 Tax=Glossina brevipalpis TaxID=37001 RepID=A0A1A9WXR9_9MUSC
MSHITILRTLFNKNRQLYQQAQQFSRSCLWQQKSNREIEVKKSGYGGSVSTDVRPLGEKIKENTKTASYVAIIVAGVGVTAVMFWTIFSELFSSTSPNNIYSSALEQVKDDPRVQDAIGAPIKGYGEESRRGRRQRVAHSTYLRNGVPHMRMQFYIQGIRSKATVHLEARENSMGKMEYRYLFVQLDSYPHTTVILEDNRARDSEMSTQSSQDQTDNTNLAFVSLSGKQ